MDIIFAASPIALILILMIGFRWPGGRAGVAGWLAALLVAGLRFGAGPRLLWWAQVRGLFQAVFVLYIIWGALIFFRVTEATGTLQEMSAALKQISPGRALQALLLAYGFSAFLQSIGGFGVPVAVVAPILISVGFPAVEAVVMPSLGDAWAVSFGSMGSSFFALTAATGLEGHVLAPWMAAMLAVVCFQTGFAVLWIAGGRAALREALAPMLAMALVMASVQWLAAWAGLWSIAAMLGALAGIAVGIAWALAQKRDRPLSADLSPAALLPTMAPYAILLIIIFAENFIPPLHDFLGAVALQVDVPQVATAQGWITPAGPTRAITLFGHPGALLIYAGIASLWLAHARGKLAPGSGKRIARGVLRSGVKSTVGILTMVGMAATMDHAGMITHLSRAMADMAGGLFPLMAPLIGAMGAFVTGSNTNSNVLFGAFQLQVAEALGYSVPVILAAHNASAAISSVVAPAKVIVGCSTVGLAGREGDVLRRAARYILTIIASLAGLALLITLVG